ncbi:hypothetical protein L6R49_02460 [Myxococcota bacterium]|nr:hypothetical protein [Myxococcota bacterium]
MSSSLTLWILLAAAPSWAQEVVVDDVAPAAPAAPAPEAIDLAPPTRVVFAPPTPVLVGTPADIARYERLRLRVVVNAKTRAWRVEDGLGNALDAWTLARLTQDEAAEADLTARTNEARYWLYGMTAGGLVLSASAFLPLLAIEDVRVPDEDDYVLSPSDFPDDRSYQIAQEDADARYQLALLATNTATGRNEERRWKATFFGISGAMIAAMGPFRYDYVMQRESAPSQTWSREEVERRIELYNESLRYKLNVRVELVQGDAAEGWAPDEAQDEVPSAPPAEPDPADPDALDPSTFKAAPGEATPGDVAPSEPGEPLPKGGPLPKAQLFLGPGMLGLRGTF